MNPFFDWANSLNRFTRYTQARAEALNAALDEVSSGFDEIALNLSSQTVSALRVGANEYVGALPDAATRANKLLTFDGNGQPTVALPAAGSATALSLLLASSVGATQIGSIASDLANTYAQMLDQRLRPMVSVLQFLTPTERSAVLSGNWAGVGDCSASLQKAINSGESLDFHRLIYRAHGLQFYYGDLGSESARFYHGRGAIIRGPGGTGNPYIIDVAGQNMTFEGLELQGLGTHDTSYACLRRVHTRSNAVSLDKVSFLNFTQRQNWKSTIYGLGTDTAAKVSEVFHINCQELQCEQIIDVQGANLVDYVAVGGYYSPAARSDGDANSSSLIKLGHGQATFIGAEVVSTSLNGNASSGWLGYIPDGATESKLTFTGCLMEAKQGFNIGSNCTNAEIRVNGMANGYWGWLYNATALFNVGNGSTGGVYLDNARFVHSYGHEPLAFSASGSPAFEFVMDEGSRLSSTLNPNIDVMTKVIGGKFNFPSMEVAMLSGRTSNSTAISAVGTVKFALDRISAKYSTHRFKGLVSDSIITIPPEGLSDAVIECLADVDQATTPIRPTRHTSLLCNVTNGSKSVSVATDQYKGGDLYERGLAPNARVFMPNGTSVGVVGTANFDNNVFELSANYPGATAQLILTFEIDLIPIVKGIKQTIALGDLWPGDKLRLTINPPSAVTDTNLSYQRLRLLGKSRMTSMTLNGGV